MDIMNKGRQEVAEENGSIAMETVSPLTMLTRSYAYLISWPNFNMFMSLGVPTNNTYAGQHEAVFKSALSLISDTHQYKLLHFCFVF